MSAPPDHTDHAPDRPPCLIDLNLRDLGGLPVHSGDVVRPGRIHRSGNLGAVSEEQRAALDALGLRTIVDLRGHGERARLGASYTPPGARRVILSIGSAQLGKAIRPAIVRGDFGAIPDDLLPRTNRALVHLARPQLGVLMRLVADPARRPILFHCTHGKDRTGFAAALVLTALGATWDTVMADYLMSNRTPHQETHGQRRMLERALRVTSRRPWRRPHAPALTRLFEVDPRNLEAARDEASLSYGDLEGYLERALGLDAAWHDTLREALLEPAPENLSPGAAIA